VANNNSPAILYNNEKSLATALKLAGDVLRLAEPSNVEDEDVGWVRHTCTQDPFCSFKQTSGNSSAKFISNKHRT
jgi:hypothetical protein